MLSRFAIGLALFLGKDPVWSTEVPDYYSKIHKKECYEYLINNISEIKVKDTNDKSSHIVFFKTGELYLVLSKENFSNSSSSLVIETQKKKTLLIMRIETSIFTVNKRNNKICINTYIE